MRQTRDRIAFLSVFDPCSIRGDKKGTNHPWFSYSKNRRVTEIARSHSDLTSLRRHNPMRGRL